MKRKGTTVKPEQLAEGVWLYEGDCLEVLPTLAPGSVDAVVTDPPYGIRYKNKRSDLHPHKNYAEQIQGDDNGTIGQLAIDYCFSNQWPVCAFADHRHPWDGNWRQWLVWDKGGAVGGGGDVKTCWKFTWELIQVGGFGVLNGNRDESVLRFYVSQADFHYHPTQKPVALIGYLINKTTKINEIILDPFSGSGTTAISAMLLGRKCILIERDPHYCEIIRRRVREADGRAPDSLFAPQTPSLFDSACESSP